MLDDYYSVLDVARTATPAELKKAYFRLIRRHTPEDSPEQFRQISEAYGTLSDPDKRRVYDTAERLPAEAQALLDEALSRSEKDAEGAAEVLAGAVRRFPHSETLRHAYALALLRADRTEDSVAQLELLRRSSPTKAEYASSLGAVRLKQDLHREAAAVLREAVLLDPKTPSSYLLLAEACMCLDEDQEALRALDRGIQADGKVDVADVPLFLKKMVVLAKLRDFRQMESTGRAVVGLAPKEDTDARDYVTAQLIQLAKMFSDLDLPQFERVVIDCAVELQPGREALRKHQAAIRGVGLAVQECELAIRDDRVGDSVKLLLALKLQESTTDQRRRVAERICGEMTENRGRCAAQWHVLRERYPHAAEVISEDWTALSTAARETPSNSYATADGRGPHPSSNSGGCLVLLAAAVGSSALFAACLLAAWRCSP